MSEIQVDKPYWHKAKFTDREVAAIIQQQLFTEAKVVLSWGATDFINIGDGLKFTVSGRLFEGQVLIVLDRVRDLYDIYFGQVQDHQ